MNRIDFVFGEDNTVSLVCIIFKPNTSYFTNVLSHYDYSKL